MTRPDEAIEAERERCATLVELIGKEWGTLEIDPTVVRTLVDAAETIAAALRGKDPRA